MNVIPANKAIFLCFFSFPIISINFLTISFLTRNTRLILGLAIPTDVPMTVLNEQTETLLASDKTSKILPS